MPLQLVMGRRFRMSGSRVEAAALWVPQRWASIGGRRTAQGFAQAPGKSPQVRQGPEQGVVRRIPGTTKIKYTNKKGRTFNFSIPVSEVMQPPVTRQSATRTGWREMDTSFCDTGDLDEDMPSVVDESLRAAIRSTEDGDAVLAMDADALAALQRSVVELCRDYTLMDTRGMKTTLTYREIHNGPDYELFDRKVRRRRHWLTIRHRLDDVRELLWPSAVLEARDGGDVEALQPVLSAEAMLEALTWVEAASTFAIRTRRPYDTAAAEDFDAIDLHREVKVLASMIRLTRSETPLLSFPSPSPSCESGDTVSRPSVLLEAAHAASSEGSGLPSQRPNVVVDRFVTCVSLCHKHNVPVGMLWLSVEAGSPSNGTDAMALAGCRAMLLNVPASLPSVQQALRVIHAITTVAADEALQDEGGGLAPFRFSSPDDGHVTDAVLLQRLASLCSPRLFSGVDALRHVDEDDLARLLQFVTVVRQANVGFFHGALTSGNGGAEGVAAGDEENMIALQSLQQFTTALLQRARRLLYRLDGPAATVVSGDDDASIPLVQLQAQAEQSQTRALVHYNIGMQHAQGMRLAKLGTRGSSRLLELVGQLEQTTRDGSMGGGGGSGGDLTTLSTDLVQHIAHKVANGKNRLGIDDVIRVLPHIGLLTDGGQNRTAAARYDRLLSACAAAIGVELQQKVSALQLTRILEGLASCGYCPSNIHVVQMGLLRLLLSGDFPLALANRSLRGLLLLLGAHAVPTDIMQRTATLALKVANAPPPSPDETACELAGDVLDLVRTLYYCRFPSLSSLMDELSTTRLFGLLHTRIHDSTAPALLLCAHGVAQTFAAVQQEEKAEADTQMNTHATTPPPLECIVRAWNVPLATTTAEACELAVDSLMALAALGESQAPAGLRQFAMDSPPSPQWWLHPLRTPSLSASVLESLCVLQLTATPLFDAYHRDLDANVSALERSALPAAPPTVDSDQVSRGGQSALDSREFAFLLRLLAVHSLGEQLTRRAGTLVLSEVERLALELESPHRVDSLTSQSTEVAALAKRQREHEAETAILRGYEALRANPITCTLLS